MGLLCSHWYAGIYSLVFAGKRGNLDKGKSKDNGADCTLLHVTEMNRAHQMKGSTGLFSLILTFLSPLGPG